MLAYAPTLRCLKVHVHIFGAYSVSACCRLAAAMQFSNELLRSFEIGRVFKVTSMAGVTFPSQLHVLLLRGSGLCMLLPFNAPRPPPRRGTNRKMRLA